MSGAFAAASLLFLVYVLQCFGSAPPISAVFVLNSRLKGRLLRHFWETSPGGRRILLLNPFLPHVGAVYADRIPVIVRCNDAREFVSLEAHPAASDSPRELSFETAHEIAPFGNDVSVDGETFLSLRSERAAQATAEFLNELQRTAAKDRLAALERSFREAFRAPALDERLERYAKDAAYLQSACLALFFFAFLLAPAAVFVLGLGRTWFAVLLYLAFSCVAIAWLFLRAYRRIYPQGRRWPTQNMATIGFSPFAAMRANDLLVADLLVGFHPVAVGHSLQSEGDFRLLAGAELRRAQFHDRDEFLVGFLAQFLKQNGVSAEALLAPPRREDSASRTYCPVCLTQYVVAEGSCKDCGNIPLSRL